MNPVLQHQPVLLHEVLESLAIHPEGIYVDATFGRGGHSRKILERLNEKGRLIVLDRDPEAIKAIPADMASDQRFSSWHRPFSALAEVAEKEKIWGRVKGVLFDFGASSPQLDDASRGFSFTQDGFLDMRMDTTNGVSAGAWLNQASETEMAWTFKNYGEEKFAKKIAAAIVEHRQVQPIETTLQLVNIIKSANPRYDRNKHPATRVFQAIRIFINDELNEIRTALESTLGLLQPGGRLVAISFHSLEDRIVKLFLREHSKAPFTPKHIPVIAEFKADLKIIDKFIKPTDQEIQQNPRARSAVLRVSEKL